MAKKTASSSRGPKPLSPDDLLEIATRLGRMILRFQAIAEESQALNVGDLYVTGTPTALKGERYLNDWLINLAGALEVLRAKAGPVNPLAELQASQPLKPGDTTSVSTPPKPAARAIDK